MEIPNSQPIFYLLEHIPDFSDKGNSRVRINCIRPQNTVFCDVDKRRSKSEMKQ
jgi:hypothetical protein